jgi:type I restriction enzyme S subunit
VVSHLAILEAREEAATPAWLYHWFCSIDLGRLARTSALPSLRLSELAELEVPVPPIADQRRIVARIKECLNRVEEMQRLREEAEAEIAVLENAWLRQRFSELATEWPQQELAVFAAIKGGGTLPKGTPTPSAKEDWLLVKVGDMNLPGNELEIVTAREYLRAGAPDDAWPVGTIVFPKRGGAIATNKKRLLGRPAILDPNLMGVIADPKKVRAAFLLAQSMILDLATLSSGSTVPQLNRKDLAPLPFVVPDLDTQDRVIAEANQISARIREMAQENACAQELEALRESILREAFAGNL